MKKLFAIAILLAGAALAVAQETPRHIDFNKPLIGLDEKPIPNLDKDGKVLGTVILSDVAVGALEAQLDEDRASTGQQKFERDTLARKIYKAKSVVLTAEELDLIKTRIGKAYGSQVVGAAWRLLDPAMK
jgi:hypothetical protein